MSSKNKVGLDMTQGPIFRTLITFAMPIVLSNLIQQLYSMVDLMVIGKFVGSVGTVAVATGSELADFMTLLAIALSATAGIYTAQLSGARDRERIKAAIGTMLSVTVIVFVVFMLVAIIFCRQLLNLVNCPDEAMSPASMYLIISALGFPFVFSYNTICGILRGMGESRRPLYFVIVAATVNIFLDILFVAVFKWDAAGTAIATVASQIGAFTASFIFFYKHREEFGFEFKLSFFKIDPHVLKVMAKLGIPYIVRAAFVQGSMLWVKSNINTYGLMASATYSIGNKVDKLMSLFVMGVSSGCGNMIGQNLGARKLDRVGKTLTTTLLFCLGVAVVVAALFLLVPKFLFGLFTNDTEVIDFGVVFLRIMSVGIFVSAFSSTYKSMAEGAGASTLCFTIGILDGICRVSVCLLFAGPFDQGAQSFFWGAALCQLVPGLVSFAYFLSGKWKTKKLLSEK